MIRLVDVRKSFGGKEVIHGIDLTVNDGETLAVIGGSGSGKSTLLRLMIGLIPPTSGEIWIGDKNIAGLAEEELDEIRLHMGMVFQYSALFDSMTVGDNVAFGLREHTALSEEEIKKVVAEKLELVGLPGAEGMMPTSLSGGMKKRVSLARAIAFGPEIIFYDEPSSGLDPIMTAKIDELITSTQKALKVTSVVVTHDMHSACRIADRIAMVAAGELVACEPVEEFLKLEDERVREFLAAAHMV